MTRKALPRLLGVWALIFYGCIAGSLAVGGTPGPVSREYLPLWIGTLVLGIAVVLLSRLVCPRLGRPAATAVGLLIGAAGPVIGGWVWSHIANEASFLVPRMFWPLGLMMAIPGATAG